MRRMILATLLLASCAAPLPPAPQGLRAAGAPIYSNASLDPARLAGHWVQVAEIAPKGARACDGGDLTVKAPRGGDLQVQADLCMAGLPAGYSGPARMSGPGRITLTSADPKGLGAEWWVLWVDADFRTLVIGTPSGRFGMILNRTADLPADRLKAAKEILDWNGYDVALLRPVAAR